MGPSCPPPPITDGSKKPMSNRVKASNEIKHTMTKRNIRNTSKQENKPTSEKDKSQRIHPQVSTKLLKQADHR